MKRFTAILLALVLVTTAYALPKAPPEVIEKIESEGWLDPFKAQMADFSARMMAESNGATDFSDSMHLLLILGEFQDISADQEKYPPGHYEEMLFSVGTYPTGSMADYYSDNSYGKFEITGDVTVFWYTAPESTAYYYCNKDRIPGTSDDFGLGFLEPNAGTFVKHLVSLADPDVDFSRYDNDDNGSVDALQVCHAGPGAESTGDPNHIWSHKSSINWLTEDGVYVRTYTIQPEANAIGVYAHEFGHALGLPDLYDTDYSSSGCGEWTIMASGSWGNGGKTPACFGAWEKYELGWVDPVNITQADLLDNPFDIPAADASDVSYRLWTDGDQGSEFFLVENRQKTGWDYFLPGTGLLIWHIDDSVGGNTGEGMDPLHVYPHYKVTVEEADCVDEEWVYWDTYGVPGSFELETGPYVGGDSGDPFPGRSGNRNFYSDSWPNSHNYLETNSKVAVLEISGSAPVMTAVFDVKQVFPVLALDSKLVDDGAGGNDDQRLEDGETADFILSLEATWGDVPSLGAVLSTESEFVTITSDSSFFGNIDYGETGDNSTNPFVLSVSGDPDPQVVEMTLRCTAMPMGVPYTFEMDLDLMIGWPQILLVVDDGDASRDEIYTAAHAELGWGVMDTWFRNSGEGTAPDRVSKHEIVVWFTGAESDSTLLPADRDTLAVFIDNGGNLFLTGQNIDSEIGETDFFADYLHAQKDQENTHQGFIIGFEGDPISHNWTEIPITAPQESPASVDPIDPAYVTFKYLNERTAGITFDGNPGGDDFKVIYLPFSYEDIDSGADRVQLLENILRFMGVSVEQPEDGAPGVSAVSKSAITGGYPNPFNPKTTIAFDLAEEGRARLAVYDIRGALVNVLADGVFGSGRHAVAWNGATGSGGTASSGIYIARLEGPGGTVDSIRLVLLK